MPCTVYAQDNRVNSESAMSMQAALHQRHTPDKTAARLGLQGMQALSISPPSFAAALHMWLGGASTCAKVCVSGKYYRAAAYPSKGFLWR
jgi:CBS-domain-containing membrane protein